MKKLILTLTVFTSLQATASEDPTYYCRAIFKEKNKIEKHDFIFDCDNYGDGATFQSKSKRFEVIGFSEESCARMIMIYDNRTKAGATTMAEDVLNAPDSALAIASLMPVTKKEMLLNPYASKDSVIVGCSTNKKLVDEMGDED